MGIYPLYVFLILYFPMLSAKLSFVVLLLSSLQYHCLSSFLAMVFLSNWHQSSCFFSFLVSNLISLNFTVYSGHQATLIETPASSCFFIDSHIPYESSGNIPYSIYQMEVAENIYYYYYYCIPLRVFVL